MSEKLTHDEVSARGGRSRSALKMEAARNNLEKAKAALAAALVGGRAFAQSFCSFRRAAPAFLLCIANPLVVRAEQLFERAEVTKATNMEEHFLRPLFAGCSQSHLSGDPLFKPLLANFALFATALFLWTLMVHDEVDLILPSEAVLSVLP